MLTQGLSQIHANAILHYDLHSGNILVGRDEDIGVLISDLGLSGPANKTLRDGKIYGVLSYIAPEVLRGNAYTDKADIYSLGMLTWEILTGQQPFSQYAHDKYLAQRICSGERPSIPMEIPEFYKEFIHSCWNDEPLQRPSAKDLSSAMDELCDIFGELMDIQGIPPDELEVIPLCSSITTSIHSEAVYTSRCFTTAELETGILKTISMLLLQIY